MTDLVERARLVAANWLGNPHSETITDLCDEIERLRDLLNKTAANNRTKARSLRRFHT